MMMVGDSVERMDAGCFPPRGFLFLVSFLRYYSYTNSVTALLTVLMSIPVLVDFPGWVTMLENLHEGSY